VKTTLDLAALQPIDDAIRAAHRRHEGSFGGGQSRRQPVHTFYGGAHLFRADTFEKLGVIARRSLATYAPDFCALARALGLPGAGRLPEEPSRVDSLRASLERGEEVDPSARLAHSIYARVLEKLEREPVEDYRIDFEDGFGPRPDAEEDEVASGAAKLLASASKRGGSPSTSTGVRIKSFDDETRARAIRTLDLFVSTLAGERRGALPEGFVVTLPKVRCVEEVGALADVLSLLERGLGLGEGSIGIEVMVETARAMFDEEGRFVLPRLVAASRRRLVAAHFGTYDYTASCDVIAAHQSMTHPVCGYARHFMQLAFAETGVFLSDGATNVIPVPIHRGSEGAPLDEAREAENRASVHAAWRTHFENITDSLSRGFYQGWDLHPAQLVARYAALYAFFLPRVDEAAKRLVSFVERAARATLVGATFDDAATGQGLLAFFLRARECGALTAEEVRRATGLSDEELALRSFSEIFFRRAAAEAGQLPR